MKKWCFLAVLVIGLVSCFFYAKDKIYSESDLPQDVTLVIPKGAASRSVANILAENNVIKNPLFFRIVARIYGFDKNLKAGEYLFPARISLYDVLLKLAKGDILYHRLTIPEGLTSFQVAQMVNLLPHLNGEDLSDIPEGSLLPETYTYKLGDSKQEIITHSQEAMGKILDKAWRLKDDDLPLKSPKELLILASLIEKETSLPNERRIVASVFVNRLRKGMRLQTDPTVIYALTQGKGELGRPLYRKDLKFESPFNTYLNYGLPPEPICNPGIESIMAAAQPEVTDFLYFVADGEGGHNFATTLREHNSNVKSWRKANRF